MSAIDPAGVRERSTPVPDAGSAGERWASPPAPRRLFAPGLQGGASLVPSSAHATGGEGRPSAAGHPSPRPMAPRVPRAGSRPRPRTGTRSGPTEPLPAAADRAGVTRGPRQGPGRARRRRAAVRRMPPVAPRAPRVRRVRRSGRRSPSRRDRRGAALGTRAPRRDHRAARWSRRMARVGRRTAVTSRAPPRSGRAAGTRRTALVRAPREAADRPGDARCAVLRPRRGHRAGRRAREAGPGCRARRGPGDSRDRS